MKHTNLLTQADRDMFDRIDRDCLAMHVVPPPKTFLKLEVVGADGVPLETYKDRAHSWVRNAYNAMSYFGTRLVGGGGSYGSGSLKAKNMAGFESNNNAILQLSYYDSSAGDAQNGIIVGSGSADESFESTTLSTLINSGSTAGTLVYQAGTYTYWSYDSDSKKWSMQHKRIFNNNSGGTITVTECGTAITNFLTSRDLLASAVTVPNGGQLTVTYTIEMTFPA